MKCTFILTITFAYLCSYINGQIVPIGTTTPPFRGNGVGGVGGGTGVNGVGGNNNGGTGGAPDYGYGASVFPYPTYQPGSSNGNDDNSVEDSTTVNPNGNGANGPNAQKAMSGGGQFALGFVAVLFVVGCAVLLVFLVRRKRAQAMKDSTRAQASA
ncbi:trihydrophobin-like [Anneissia japonica]|uniref:trihydrophobin-like n=1 Tax=Anneissia japonica TaxID=1529436 RepID=UPI00142567D5|nr:trihydrophobin-like [Anneissia japonica]